MMASFFNRFDVRVGGVYLIIAALWVIFSDSLIARLSNTNTDTFQTMSTWKALGFIAVSTLALVIIISREMRKHGQVEQALQQDILERKRIEEQAREQGRFAEALRDSLFALTASLDVNQVMQQILDSAANVVPSEAGSIILFENNKNRVAFTRGFPADAQTQIQNYLITDQDAQSASAFGGGKPYLISDTALEPGWVMLPATTWIRSSLGVPIELREKVIGVLIADSAEPNHFQQSDLDKLTAFARYAALALENAYHVTRLEQKVLERTTELQSAKIRVEAILNNSLDGILLAYTDFHVQQTNATFNNLLACGFDDYFDRSLLELIHEDDAEHVAVTLEEVLVKRVGKQIETRIRRKNGTVFDAELSIGYIRDMNNEMDSLVCALRDITNRKQAEQSLTAKMDEEREFQNHLKTLHEITIELTQIDELDEFYKRAVEAGRERLGFERFALFLYNEQDTSASGTYGTTVEGCTVDEHHIHLYPDPDGIMMRAFLRDERFAFVEQTQLHNDHQQVVGSGWNATSVMRNGTQALGWLVADNLIGQKPATKPQLEILSLYGLTLGTLLAHKKSSVALKNSENRLRESQQMLQNVMETIPVRVFWKDKNSVFLGANRLFLQDMGLQSSEEIVGKREFGHETRDQINAYESDDQAVMLSGLPKMQFEETLVRPDGSMMWLETSKVPLRDNSGEIIGILGAYIDITERKEAEQALSAKIDEEREFQKNLKALHEITIQLTQLDDLNDFYRCAIELGLERLGFDRMGLMLYDDQRLALKGTFGTDTQGRVIDERGVHFVLPPTHLMSRALERVEHVAFDSPIPLYQHGEQFVGMGWNAIAVLRNGAEILGWLSTDNLIHQKPITKPLLDILELYGLTLGTLLARKQTDLALRESEARLRDSQQMLQNVLETIPVRVFWKDRNSVYMGGNHLFVKDTGMASLKDVIGKSDYEMPWPKLAETYINADHQILYEGVDFLEYEQAIMGSDGMLHWYEQNKVPLRNIAGEVIGILGMYTDITERKNSEEALRKAFDRERELGELKSRFVAMTSHELRTPLTSILSSAEILTRYRHKMDGEQIEEKLDLIARQVRHLADIIEDVLNLGRMQSGHTEYRPVRLDFDQLCKEIVTEFQSQPAVTHEVLYSCAQSPVMVYLDQTLIRQVVNNLISNAIKYSPTGTSISVTLKIEPDAAVLCVRDSGIGIPEADLKHLFQPFHRARNVGTISGTGLGLAISKEAVERHGGTIEVESEVGVGTTICAHLPLT